MGSQRRRVEGRSFGLPTPDSPLPLVSGQFGHAPRRPRERDARVLVGGEGVDHEVARGVERERGADDVGVAGDAGAEAVAGLGQLLLGEAEPLARRLDLLAGRREIKERAPDLDRRLLAEVAAAHVELARDRRLLLDAPLAAEAL